MHKNDAVAFALLGIGGGHKKLNPQAHHCQHGRQSGKPGPQTAGQKIEVLRRSELEPVNHACFHSREILKAVVVAKGAKNAESTSSAANSDRWPPAPRPAASASTAPAPNISTGIYRGRINNDSNTPAPRTPKVRAAPML